MSWSLLCAPSYSLYGNLSGRPVAGRALPGIATRRAGPIGRCARNVSPSRPSCVMRHVVISDHIVSDGSGDTTFSGEKCWPERINWQCTIPSFPDPAALTAARMPHETTPQCSSSIAPNHAPPDRWCDPRVTAMSASAPPTLIHAESGKQHRPRHGDSVSLLACLKGIEHSEIERQDL